jgi:competence protein ComEC
MRLTDRFRTETGLLSFALGVVLAQQVTALPSFAVCVFTLALFGLVAFFLALRPQACRLSLLCACALGVGASYALLRAEVRMSDELPRTWEAKDIEIVGVIDEMPQRNEQGIRFAFRVEEVLTPHAKVPTRIALGWYKPSIRELAGEALPELRAGERWRWTVRLKRPHGYVNPAGFDLEAWLLERNLRASGSIQVDEPVKRLSANADNLSDLIERQRETIRERMQRVLQGKRYGGVLIALAIGDQQAISDADWALFNATGVSHLLSISGAHVTLFALWFAWCVGSVWRRSPSLVGLVPTQRTAALAAAIVALGYASLTGFAVPAQRTCYMLIVLALGSLMSRSLSSWLVLAWALVIVLAVDPWAAVSVGFWFSFTAVAILIYVTEGRVARRSAGYLAVKSQIAVTLGLAPISMAFFQQASWVGPLANAIAIPLVTFVVVPLTLTWLVVPVDPMLFAAHALIAGLATALNWFASLASPLWQQHASPIWVIVLAIAGLAWLLAPRVVPHRWLGALWCLPLFTVTPNTPDLGEFRATVLDIGQGTAVVIRTHTKTLVYDTGPRWRDDTDAGSRLIAPFLRASGSGTIDGLVVSHLDLDHSGGANTLLRGMPVKWMLTSAFDDAEIIATAREQGASVIACQAGQSWSWDAVYFEVLHPQAESYRESEQKSNDRSCVIKVTARTASFLLTGDIETTSEQALTQAQAARLRSDAMLIPHHGSTTSSSPSFIETVQPKLALINAGYRNRFGHPRASVLDRYRDRNVDVYRTDWHGAITLESADRFSTVRRERDERQRYWVDRPDPEDRRPIE